MATITCAISSISFKVDYLSTLSIPHTAGYFHPIFAASHSQLQDLYSKHCTRKLTPTDSYLLFLAFLHSTGQVEWDSPATLDPNSQETKILIENNISQLLSVIAMSDAITLPSFSQPSFRVTIHNSSLPQIKTWVSAWRANINSFHTFKATSKDKDTLQKVENELTFLIRSDRTTKEYAHIVAEWACLAGEFPVDKKEEWKRIIRSCFNVKKMFATPISLLKEIKEYCEQNIEVGSIHFHTLYKVLNEGISSNINYLGFEVLPNDLEGEEGEGEEGESNVAIIKAEKELQRVLDIAPNKEPLAGDYKDSLSFLKAKLAYRVAKSQKAKEKRESLHKAGL